ncbi:hypothetical protein H072_8125 [Dactylellina haptotyla CBS 200.50]|uniref:tyrosinase n=1 Tax=Dactylellina haptotyla (strain CBS 200.50) TaxID=1284197 RepID=S8A5L9_DACHA|nr:hypothetical protein H072_8125 [Dactylellina haptotyla CBS 200.50]
MSSGGTYAITGVQTGRGQDNSSPIRQEIDAWSADPANVDQVNLYLQALASFQLMPVSDKLSYFQVAGIHGEPFRPWDENTPADPRTRWRGYCTHASVLFPTWHRPYLALYEQILHSIMTQIVATYPDNLRPRYQAAADAFRIPYWDFGQLKTRGGVTSLNVPYLCTLPSVEVFTPTGMSTIDNPLYSFKFSGPPQGVTSFQDQDGNFYPFSTSVGTSRYPPQYNARDPTVTAQWTQGYVDNEAITQALQNLSSLGEDVYRSFTTNNYTWYSSTQQSNPPAPNSYQSLEAIHNEIHGIVGGGGHMSWNTVSSFDPIFWLHHCNVDRLFAIWQVIYPTSWFDSPSAQLRDDRGTWSIPAGTRETPNTPLTPFHKDNMGGVFNSNEIRDWNRFGSSYTELQQWLPKYRDASGQFNPTLYRNDVIDQVTNLYSRVQSRVRRTRVPQNRLFASAQSGPQNLTGGSNTMFAAMPATQSSPFAPPPQPTFSPASTSQATTAQAQQFAPPPTQQFAPPPTQSLDQAQHFSPPPTQGQQFAPPPMQTQQFAPPPTQEQPFAPPPNQTTTQQPPNTLHQQFAPPQQAGPAQKQSGLRGLMSSAQKHLGEAVAAGREAATHGNNPNPQQQQQQQQQQPLQPGAKPSGASALATKFGGIVGGGFHMAQERLGSKKQSGAPGGAPGGSRGIDDEPGHEGGELSRGFGDMNLGQPHGGEPLTYHEYDANIRFERFDLGGRPFTIHIFIGDFNPDPKTWMWDKNRVGGVFNFAAGVQRSDGSACSNCEQQQEDHTIVTGQVSLTTALLDDVEDPANGLNSLIPEEVIPYLQRHLHWRITDPNGREIPRDLLRTLKISVVECSATLPTQPGEFIHYGDHRVLDIVTEGRPGGKAASDGY